MPEGPEIRIEADRIGAVLTGEVIEEALFGLPRLAHRTDEILGAAVIGVAPHGKAMLVSFNNGLTLYSHNQLYGKWMVRKSRDLPKSNRSLRVALHTRLGSALLYSASDIALLDDGELAAHPFLAKLGPDILDPALTWRAVAARLADKRFARRRLGALYLDQSFLAGNGNYLRSEVLWFARLHPALTPNDLTVKQRNELARQTLTVARRSYETRGLTAPPAVVKAGKKAGQRRGSYRFCAFSRAGKACHDCGDPIERTEFGGRRLYLCPNCQPAP